MDIDDGFTTPVKAVKHIKVEDQIESSLDVVMKEVQQDFTTPIKLDANDTASKLMLTPVVFASKAKQAFWKKSEDAYAEQVMNAAIIKARIINFVKQDLDKLRYENKEHSIGVCQSIASWFPKTARVLLIVCARNPEARDFIIAQFGQFLAMRLNCYDTADFIVRFDEQCYEFLMEVLDELNKNLLADVIQTQVQIVMSRKHVPLVLRKREREALYKSMPKRRSKRRI